MPISSTETPNILTHSITEIRRYLHKYPELSGQEYQTANYVTKQLQSLNPSYVYQHIAKTGVAAVFDSERTGKTLLFRCELDALPIQEIHDDSYRSKISGVSHQCGHDGHMAIILNLAKRIASNRPKKGRVVLLFQPAEETGEGARQVVADAQFSKITPDESYALHNLPEHPLGEVMIKQGSFNCASRGLIVRLSGRTAHAAYPETGISPQLALAELLQKMNHVAKYSQIQEKTDELMMITVVHCSMGEQAFGTSPADACLMATLRTESNEMMDKLVSACQLLAKDIAQNYQLTLNIDFSDVFDASVNDADCVEQVINACEITGNPVKILDAPFRWSEDFGAISAVAKGTMFAFGAGEGCPQIHNPDYLFDDELIQQGSDIFFEVYRQLTE